MQKKSSMPKMDLYMYKSGSMLETVLARTMRKKLPKIMASDAWLWLSRGVIMELLEDTNLQVTEGQLFTGIVKWCRANTVTEQEAINKFQHCFADKIFGKNISAREFLEVIQPLEKFIPDKQFRQWTFEMEIEIWLLRHRSRATSRTN